MFLENEMSKMYKKPTDWNALGHKLVQNVCWFACGFLTAYLAWGPK